MASKHTTVVTKNKVCCKKLFSMQLNTG